MADGGFALIACTIGQVYMERRIEQAKGFRVWAQFDARGGYKDIRGVRGIRGMEIGEAVDVA